MPGTVQFTPPTEVFPAFLSRAFTEAQEFAANVSEYHDGSSQRSALVLAPRHRWRMSKRLPPSDLITLRTFVLDHIARNFYFYNPKETIPPNTVDPTGVASDGRYAVRMNSDWVQSCGVALTDTTVELIEVIPMSEAVVLDVWITMSPEKGISVAANDLAPPLTVLLDGNGQVFRCLGAICKSKLGSTGVMDLLYKEPGGVYASIFPGTSGITIDAARTSSFSTGALNIPDLSELRLDCKSITPISGDEIVVQVRGRVI